MERTHYQHRLDYNSKKAWKTIKNLNSENKPPSRVAAITPNQVAHQLLLNEKPDSKHNWSPKSMKMQFQQVMQDSSQTTKPISLIEVQEAIKHIKPGKASGLDGIISEMINHFGPTTRKWILALFNQCLENSKIPKIWKKARVIAVGVQVEPLGEGTAKRPYGHLVCCHLTSTASVLHMCTTP